MSGFKVDPREISEVEPSVSNREPRWLRIIHNIARAIVVIAIIAGIVSFFYWRSLKYTPQYSLALIVDAAKRDDQQTIDSLVDVNAVVDDFIPQITEKAVELYGRGLPTAVISKLANIAAPVLPAVKDRARAELPRLIRDRVERLPRAPFAVMVIGAGRYFDITVDGEIAIVKSKLSDHPLELKMRRNGTRWQIVGVKDDALATSIAKKIGQEIIAIAVGGSLRTTADALGVGNLTKLIRQAEELLR